MQVTSPLSIWLISEHNLLVAFRSDHVHHIITILPQCTLNRLGSVNLITTRNKAKSSDGEYTTETAPECKIDSYES